MPVPQRMSFIVEQASCLFLNGQDARSTKNEFYCGTGILPVPKQVIEKGATSQLKQTMGKALKWRILAIITS